MIQLRAEEVARVEFGTSERGILPAGRDNTLITSRRGWLAAYGRGFPFTCAYQVFNADLVIDSLHE